MPRVLTAYKVLSVDEQREFAARRMRGATIGELEQWCASLGKPLTRRQVRTLLERVDRQAERIGDAVAIVSAVLGEPERRGLDDVLRAAIAIVAVAAVEFTRTYSIGMSATFVDVARVIALLARAHRDLEAARTGTAAEPENPTDAPRRPVLPPGTVEFIRSVYGLAPDPPRSAPVPADGPDGPDPR